MPGKSAWLLPQHTQHYLHASEAMPSCVFAKDVCVVFKQVQNLRPMPHPITDRNIHQYASPVSRTRVTLRACVDGSDTSPTTITSQQEYKE